MGKRVSVLRFMYETRVYLFGSGPLAGNTRVQGYALHSRLLSSSLTLAFEGRRRQILLLNGVVLPYNRGILRHCLSMVDGEAPLLLSLSEMEGAERQEVQGIVHSEGDSLHESACPTQ